MTDVIVPDELWEGNEDGVVTTWLADDGSSVRKDDLLAEFMLQKVTIEIRAPADGTLKILRQPNEVIHRGDVLARVE